MSWQMSWAKRNVGANSDEASNAGRSSTLPGGVRQSLSAGLGRLRDLWGALNLAQQFTLAAAAVLAFGMVLIGLWVGERIKQGVTQNSAASAALYMDSFIAPVVQELAHSDHLSEAAQSKLDDLLQHTSIGSRVAWIKIWRLDGVIVYSNRKSLIGKQFAPSKNFLRASRGTVAADFDGPHHAEETSAQGFNIPLLEIYAPVRETNTDRIIAVSEFYEMGDRLKAELNRATALSWIVVGAVTALMMAALSGIVYRGSRTIDEQQHHLQSHIRRLQLLLNQNEELSQRVQRAYKRTADINERFLRRIGADLHDGPAQLLSLALLRLDSLAPALEGDGTESNGKDVERVRAVLTEAFQEIRNISAGLALPELGKSTVEGVLRMAARAHESRTQTSVRCEISGLPEEVPHQIKVCLYRFVQEGLMNAFRHAKGQGQRLIAGADNGQLKVEIADSGGGIKAESPKMKGGGLGLSGLRDRIETLGGTLDIRSIPQTGTRLIATFSLAKMQQMEQLDG